MKIEILNKTFEIDNMEFDGINHRDYPDYCDAFICSADVKEEGKEWRNATDEELDQVMNEYTDFFYESLMSHIH
jgi:hypothetical protein